MKNKLVEFYDIESDSSGLFLMRITQDLYAISISTQKNGDIDIAVNKKDLEKIRDAIGEILAQN